MDSPNSDNFPLIIKENTCIKVERFNLQIEQHLGQIFDVQYFQVKIIFTEPDLEETCQTGLLRVGTINGQLSQERQLRDGISPHKMIPELMANLTLETQIEIPIVTANIYSEKNQEQDSEYLPEENYDPEPELVEEKLLFLTCLPNPETTLESWLQVEHSWSEYLLIASQICQFFRYVYQQKWCIVSLLPKYIKIGSPIQFLDLTGAYKVGTQISFSSDYCAPELTYNHCPINEYMSTYLVGIILYQAIHKKPHPKLEDLTDLEDNFDLEIQQIPQIYQILKIALAPSPQDRFDLSQLLNLLVKTRQTLQHPTLRWEIATRSTVGLSTSRLQNEDSYGFRQTMTNQSEPLMLAVVADGMGGMAQGEKASQIAVQTVLNAPIPSNLSAPLKRDQWLISLVQQANQEVSHEVQNGGTTISLILAVQRELNIAHVGDSRIYLLRNNVICQLSEDHSYVALLYASGEITSEEIYHRERNIILKSLGNKSVLSEGYVQTLSRFGGELFLKLEDRDILILCTDGVWDLIPSEDLGEIFSQFSTLEEAVQKTLEQIIEKGADDNATILSLKLHLKDSQL